MLQRLALPFLIFCLLLAPPCAWAKASQNSPANPASTQTFKSQKGRFADTIRFSGNVKTFKYHKSTCRFYNCKDCIRHFNTREEALDAGYEACKKCGG